MRLLSFLKTSVEYLSPVAVVPAINLHTKQTWFKRSNVGPPSFVCRSYLIVGVAAVDRAVVGRRDDLCEFRRAANVVKWGNEHRILFDVWLLILLLSTSRESWSTTVRHDGRSLLTGFVMFYTNWKKSHPCIEHRVHHALEWSKHTVGGIHAPDLAADRDVDQQPIDVVRRMLRQLDRATAAADGMRTADLRQDHHHHRRRRAITRGYWIWIVNGKAEENSAGMYELRVAQLIRSRRKQTIIVHDIGFLKDIEKLPGAT